MSQNKNRIRAQSAKPYSERQRPVSSKIHKFVDKSGLIQKIYTNIPNLQQRPNSGRSKVKVNSLYLASNLSNLPGGTIQKQTLLQQNLQLKKKLHVFEEQIAKMNGKMQSYKSKMSKINGPMSVEFQNENLWAKKNAYLVTGVKNQYECLKAKYKEKCDELNAIKNINVYTNMKELQKENEALKRENSKLVQNLIEFQMKSNILHNNSSDMFKSQQNKANQFMVSELQYKLSAMEDKLTKKNDELSSLRQNFQLELTRVKFLEKLTIQKDNSLHALHLKNKRLQKQKLIYMTEIDQITKKVSHVEEKYEEKIKNVQELEYKQSIRQKEIYTKSIGDKNVIIEKLEKQVAYLTTLLSYWKPLDEQKQQKNNSPQKNNKISQNEEKAQQQKRKKVTNLNEAFSIINKTMAQRKTSEQLLQNQKDQALPTGPRTQNRADKKRTEGAKKVRRVKDSEVQQTGELIRFRLIAQRISIQAAKDFFTFRLTKSQLSEQQESWHKQYITMRQACAVLKSAPFSLTQEQATFLSRYMVEDVMNDYIYCDSQNENKRDIVKSILKNVVGDYHVDKTVVEIEKETEVELGKYKSKISTILEQMYPGGLISKRKLIQIFVGSGLQIQEDVLEYIIGKIAIKSETLNSLDYRILL